MTIVVVKVDAPSGTEYLSTKPFHTNTSPIVTAHTCITEFDTIWMRLDGRRRGDVTLTNHPSLAALAAQNLSGSKATIYKVNNPGDALSSAWDTLKVEYMEKDGDGYTLRMTDPKAFWTETTSFTYADAVANCDTKFFVGSINEFSAPLHSLSGTNFWFTRTYGDTDFSAPPSPLPGYPVVSAWDDGSSYTVSSPSPFGATSYYLVRSFISPSASGEKITLQTNQTGITALQMMQELIQNNSTEITAVSFGSDSPGVGDGIGIHALSGEVFQEICDQFLLNSLGMAWWIDDTTIQARVIEEPVGASADASITQDVIMDGSFKVVRRMDAWSSLTLTVDTTYIDSGVTAGSGAATTSIWTNSGTAGTETITYDTYLRSGSSTNTLASTRGSIRNSVRLVWQFAAYGDLSLNITDIINVTRPADGFDSGKNLAIVAVGRNPLTDWVWYEAFQ